MVIQKVTSNIYKSNHDSNIYYVKDLNIIIDAGNEIYKEQFKKDLSEIVDLKTIKTIILTHLHFDHIGCFDLFPNAKFYANKNALSLMKTKKTDAILDANIANNFNITLNDINELNLPDFYKIIETPGHSACSISIYDKKNKILFSGDTLFFNDNIGRYDLPTSNYDDLKESLQKLKRVDIKTLCPGHDY